jgi:uncharacterized membrane protein
MTTPFHPSIAHLPLALTVVLPFLIMTFAFFIKGNKMSSQAWLMIIGLQLTATISGYVALESGEDEEKVVEKVVDRKIIHEHEEAAEVFVGFTVLALVISIATYFLQKEKQFYLQLVVSGLSFIAAYLAYNTGKLGGDLVYQHGAAQAYVKVKDSQSTQSEGLLPTPGMNTSESAFPVNENESLKTDDNDYGNADDESEAEDEDFKQED